MQTKRLRRLRGVRLFSRSSSLQRRKYDGTLTIDDVFATDRISKAIDINGRQRVFHPICRVLLGTATVDENNPQPMVKLARSDGFTLHDIGHEPSPNGDVAYLSLTNICGVSFLKRTFRRSVVSTTVPCVLRALERVRHVLYEQSRVIVRKDVRRTAKRVVQIYSFAPSFGASSRRRKRSCPTNFPRC